jgi:hypothetical protein
VDGESQMKDQQEGLKLYDKIIDRKEICIIFLYPFSSLAYFYMIKARSEE